MIPQQKLGFKLVVQQTTLNYNSFFFPLHLYSSELRKRSKDLMSNTASDESVLRRSTRVRAPPRQNPANAFLRYANKWKEE